jgi:CheY-like chemotaxis protein
MTLLDSRIDGIITDIHMPEMDGVEFALKVRERLGPVPIAFCTGSEPDDQMVQQAAEIGRILPKLWTLDQVMVTLEEFRELQASPPRARR